MKGFTLFELLIAMMLTAVIGTVMFKTWDVVIRSGEKARQTVESRERDRIVLGIMDNDIAGINFPETESATMPGLSRNQVLPEDGFYEIMGRKKDAAMQNGETVLLSFSTSSTIAPDGPRLGSPVCVEYRLTRQSADRYRLKRRERAMCGVSGDFPWSEISLMDNLQSADMKLVFEDGREIDAGQTGDQEISPTSIKFSFRRAGETKDTYIYFPLFARSEDVDWEDKTF